MRAPQGRGNPEISRLLRRFAPRNDGNAQSMKLNVYSLQKVLFRGDATAVNCRTTSGEITILDHHRQLISVLTKGILKITKKGDEDTYIPIRSGFLEVRSGNEAKFLVEEG